MISRIHCMAGLAAAGALLAGPAAAHHSASMYDFEHTKVIEGTVKDFLWINPHAMLSVVVPAKNGQPEQLWTIENTSPGRLTRAGWSKRTFNRGDRVKVEVRPLRDGKNGGFLNKAILIDTNTEVSLRGVGPVGTLAPPPAGPPPDAK